MQNMSMARHSLISQKKVLKMIITDFKSDIVQVVENQPVPVEETKGKKILKSKSKPGLVVKYNWKK